MPIFFNPDGSYSIREEVDEKDQETTTVPSPIENQTPVVEPKEGEAKPEPTKEEDEAPNWWTETVKTLAGSIAHIPDAVYSSLQERAQVSTPTQLYAQFGGDPTSMLLTQAALERKTPVELAEEQKKVAERGQKFAAQGLTVPDEKGEVKKFGIPSNTPILGTFGKGGKLYEFTNPETKAFRNVKDIGTLLATAYFMPTLGVGGGARKATVAQIKSAAQPRNINRLLRAGVDIAKRIGYDLPQDFAEEVMLLSTGVQGGNSSELYDQFDNLTTTEKQALVGLIEADTDEAADYYKNFIDNVFTNTAQAGVFRGVFGGLNQALRARKLGKIKAGDDFNKYSRLFEKDVQQTEEAITKSMDDNAAAQTAEELFELNTNFNKGYREAFPTLNRRVSGQLQADLSIKESIEQAKGFGQRSIEVGQAAEAEFGQVADLNKLIQNRRKSMAEMDKLARQNPDYLKGKNKTRYKRYEKQIKDFEKRIEGLQKTGQERLAELDEIEQREFMAGEQFDVLQTARNLGAQGLTEDIDAWFGQLNKINELRTAKDPNQNFAGDPFYESYQRLRDTYNAYKFQASGDQTNPNVETATREAQSNLYAKIQEEYNALLEQGGADDIPVTKEALDAAFKLNFPEKAGEKVSEKPGEKPEAPTEKKERPWENTKQVALKSDESGNAVVDPDVNTFAGATELPPETPAARIRVTKQQLGLSPAEALERVEEGMSAENQKRFVDNLAAAQQAQDDALRAGRSVPYDWDASADKALMREMGGSYGERKAALASAFKTQTESNLPKALERAASLVGRMAKAEGDYVELQRFLGELKGKRAASAAGAREAMVQSLVVGQVINSTGARLFKVYDAYKKADLSTIPEYEANNMRAVMAQEGLVMYQAVDDFMNYRRLFSDALSSLKTVYRKRMRSAFEKSQQKQRRLQQEADADQKDMLLKLETESQEINANLAESLAQDLNEYIGLDSTLSNVEGILNKFKDPSIEKNPSEIALFEKLVANLTYAGANPEMLGSLKVKGDDVLVRTWLDDGLSNPVTQTSFPPMTAIYAGSRWIGDLTNGYLNELWNYVPWMKSDPEQYAKAAYNAQVAREMLLMRGQGFGDFMKQFYYTRLFNRSVLYDAVGDAVDTRFGGAREVDRVREMALLDMLGDESELQGFWKRLSEVTGPERAKQLRNHFGAILAQAHDTLFYGDAFEKLDNTGISKFAKRANNVTNPSMWAQHALNTFTPIKPFESKLPGGERLGGSFWLRASEFSTELIGGSFAQTMSRAMANIEAGRMLVDANGRPLYRRNHPKFVELAEQIYKNKYVTPIKVGIGDNAREIAFGVKNEEVRNVAVALDNMEAAGDSILGKIQKGARSLANESDPTIKLLKASQAPYTTSPLNGLAKHFFYNFPVAPFLNAGTVFEGAVALQRLKAGRVGSGEFGEKLLTFESQFFHKDPAVRARAKQALVAGNAFIASVYALVTTNAIEVTGGMTNQYQEGKYGYRTPYTIRLGDWDFPYRWIPYLGEVLGYSANMRDLQKANSRKAEQHAFGIAAVAMAQTFLDAPAIAAVDTFISALKNPEKAEEFFIDYIAKYTGFHQALFRKFLISTAGNALDLPPIEARPIVSGSTAGLLRTSDFSEPVYGEEKIRQLQEQPENTAWSDEFQLLLKSFGDTGASLGRSFKTLVFTIANKTGLQLVTDSLESELRSEITAGDNREAHWYKEGDVKYLGPGQETVMGSILGRHWPAPVIDDPLDVEMFRHGVKPPEQVFRRFNGAIVNEVAINRFRRFLGSEYRNEFGQSTEQIFRTLIEGNQPVPGEKFLNYNDLPDDGRNSMALDATTIPTFPEGQLTKRDALMALRNEIVQNAAEQFMRGYRTVTDPVTNETKEEPLKYAAPPEMQEVYNNWLSQQ